MTYARPGHTARAGQPRASWASISNMEDATPSSPEADAAHEMAIKAAEGDGLPQDWTAALDHLQRSAQLGSRLAQAELAGLAGQWTLAHDILAGKGVPDSRWLRYRSSIDLTNWLEPPPKSNISERPRIAVVKDIAMPEMCDWLIARARPRLKPAQIYDDKEGRHRSASGRTNTLCPFPGPDRDLILAVVRARAADVTGMPVRAMESPHILHYSMGEEFRPHFDTPDNPNSPGFRQRVLTLLISLNDDYEGGETEFPAINGRWKGRKGSALFFWNVEPDGTRDPRTLHAGLPVTRGEKWLLSQWIGPAEG
jgi:prolyl 4-hydroxylase